MKYVKPDIDIAREFAMSPITEIAEKLGLSDGDLDQYGKYKAKINDSAFDKTVGNPDGALVLVTAVNPTPAGEGKTTVTIGLAQALNRLGKNAVCVLREPSLGPCMGVKGGATGGGYAQVVPMEDINLHFTGDIHAVTCANNLLAAMIDNHLQQGNGLGLDPRRIVWKRSVDMNDRSLRRVVVGLGGKPNGVPREDGFMISVASEVMAVLCLSESLADLKARLGSMIVGYSYDDKPVTAADLKADGAMAALLKEAIKPNLVQTLERTPAIIHGGPFANIAHGCNSVRATKLALKLGSIIVTEAGFGADLGAEKFFDIKCRGAGLSPKAAVIVVTIRSAKYNGGVSKADLSGENVGAVRLGLENLRKHIENISKYRIPSVVALNRFNTDTDAEIAVVRETCESLGAAFALSEVWAKGGEGGEELALRALDALNGAKSEFTPLYPLDMPVAAKIETVCREIYGASGVNFAPPAKKQIEKISAMGYGGLPVCIAKTQYSLSDNPKLLGRPKDFEITVREVSVSAGAGFIVCVTGDITTMPGLPKTPAACGIDIADNGDISGLF